jgi:hypothetical protein
MSPAAKPPKSPYAPIDMPAKPSGKAKFWIQSHDKPALGVVAQYNPKELTITREVPWSPPGEAGGGGSSTSASALDLEFTGAKARSLSVELFFDGFEEQAAAPYTLPVMASIKILEELSSVQMPGKPTAPEEKRRPHKCIATWGPLEAFPCVITSIETKYTMFDTDGTPLRATCTLKLLEAGKVSTKDTTTAAPATTTDKK